MTWSGFRCRFSVSCGFQKLPLVQSAVALPAVFCMPQEAQKAQIGFAYFFEAFVPFSG